ncbi:N-6 DNA methylase [Zeaxanthinibacter enoshimensis]|uniref:site-specific DNA-methyltransferase (adenine-specific) n=1 Tax=Zeaxanthinibacter enoshimensis TaxID=392009 RepID=A0A4R6TT41_9FLAO|nr:N-6 DNA methylase [Zeaxanthinibacter enoshimensis]TDQ33373.1 type I restriction modification DNA specificity protein [Zeaxanthinibacter enoshimensis]
MNTSFELILSKLYEERKDVFNLENILEAAKTEGIKLDKNDIADHLSSNRNLNYHSTPNEIAMVMSDIIQFYQPKSIADICSGLGNILYYCNSEAYRVGYEINDNIVKIAEYLFPEIEFICTNTLKHSFRETYDCVCGCLPFGKTIFDQKTINNNQVFIKKGLELLNPGGLLVCIVRDNFLNTTEFDTFRQKILEQYYLKGVISLPEKSLQGTSAKCSIIIIENRTSDQETEFYSYTSTEVVVENFRKSNYDFKVSKIGLIRWDFDYNAPENSNYEQEIKNYKLEKLGILASILPGAHINSKSLNSFGEIRVIRPVDISRKGLVSYFENKFIEESHFDNLPATSRNSLLQKGDIVISAINKDHRLQLYFHNTESRLIANQHLIIIRNNKNSFYLWDYLSTNQGQELLLNQIKKHLRGGVLPRLTLRDLKEFEIPILPNFYTDRINNDSLLQQPVVELSDKLQQVRETIRHTRGGDNQSIAVVEMLNTMYSRIEYIIANQSAINNKLDHLIEKIENLSIEFSRLKHLPREESDIIRRMEKLLDSRIEEFILNQDKIELHLEEIHRWFDHFDLLEPKSKLYLPQAEFLFDQISRLSNPDYSPFIIQYCRAFENEMLLKLFRRYVQSLIDRNIDIDQKFYWDLGLKENGKPNSPNTYRLAKHFKKCITKDSSEWYFELGNMEMHLRYLTGNSIRKSALLQDIKDQILQSFTEDILEVEFLDELRSIIKNYRNKSAHPDLMNSEAANQFRILIQSLFNDLFENYKTPI